MGCVEAMPSPDQVAPPSPPFLDRIALPNVTFL